MLEWDDVHRLADALPEQYRPVAYLAALGLRRAEVFGLQLGDLDFARRTLSVRRTVTPVEGKLEVDLVDRCHSSSSSSPGCAHWAMALRRAVGLHGLVPGGF